MAEIVRFDAWARQLPGVDVSPAHWASRLASRLSMTGHNEEALSKCVEIDMEASEAWPALLKAAEVSRLIGKHEDALKYLHQIKSDHLGKLDEDPRLKKAYWITLLPEEGHNHWSLKDFAEAETCLRKVIGESEDQDAISAHKDSMALLFKLWDERRAYDSAFDQVKQWMASTDSGTNTGHWFLLMWDSEPFHKCLASIVARREDSMAICNAYEEILASLDPVKDLRAIRDLRCSYATAKYHSSYSSVQRNIAFHQWEHVILTSGDDSESWSPAPEANRCLSRRLLDDAITSGLSPMSHQASEYADMLENLGSADSRFVQDVREGNEDPHLPLMRLYFLAGYREKVQELAMDRLRSIFDRWPSSPNSPALLDRYAWLGQVFSVMGDDANAFAAWGLLEPKRSKAADREDTVAGAEKPTGEESFDQPNNVSASQDATKDKVTEDDPEGRVDSRAAEKGNEETIKGTPKATVGPQSEADADIEVPDLKNTLADLESDVSYWCDNCDVRFKAMANLYICRHCLNLHLCPPCHAKLQNEELHVLMCSPKHEHLYMPPFDRERWESMDPESMVVNGEIVPRAVWLDGLREKWGLRQESIDAHKSQLAAQVQAAKVLTRWRKGLLKLRAVSAVTK